MNVKRECYYETLGVDSYCSPEGIKRAFRGLAKVFHPDMESGDRKNYDRIREAYEFLSDEELRKDYDQEVKRRMAQEKERGDRERIAPIDVTTKICIILAWSTENPSFNPSFVHSCLDSLASGKKLSEKQINSLENIIVRFKINLDYWLDDQKRNDAIQDYFKFYDLQSDKEKDEDPFAAFHKNTKK